MAEQAFVDKIIIYNYICYHVIIILRCVSEVVQRVEGRRRADMGRPDERLPHVPHLAHHVSHLPQVGRHRPHLHSLAGWYIQCNPINGSAVGPAKS